MPPHADIVRELSLRQNSHAHSSTFLLSCIWTDDIPGSNSEYQIMPLPLQGFDQVVAMTQACINATINTCFRLDPKLMFGCGACLSFDPELSHTPGWTGVRTQVRVVDGARGKVNSANDAV